MPAMTRNEVAAVVEAARADNKNPDLRYSDLKFAELFGTDLQRANLLGADLRYSDLRGANLRGANLRGADLDGADLDGADLDGADLDGAKWFGLQVTGLHPYQCLLWPTPDGWQVRVGCWAGTLHELQTLIDKDTGWPEAEGEEITRRRPLLQAFIDMGHAHIAAHPEVVPSLQKK